MFSTAKNVLFIAILFAPSLFAVEPPEHLVSSMAFKSLPESYRIPIDSNGNGEIQLVVLGEKYDFSGVTIRMTLQNNSSMELHPNAEGTVKYNINDAILISTDKDTHQLGSDSTASVPSNNPKSGPASITILGKDLDVLASIAGYTVEGNTTERFVAPVIKNSGKEFIKIVRRDVTDPLSESLTFASYDTYQKDPVPFYRVRLRADGRLTGFTVVPKIIDQELAISNSMNVSIIRDGQPVSRTISTDEGSFEFSDLEPGVYGVIAGGPAGFSAFSFELLEAGAPEITTVSTRANVNRMASVADDLVVLVTPTSMLAKALEPIEQAIAEYNAGNLPGTTTPMTNIGPGTSPAGSPAAAQGLQGSGFAGSSGSAPGAAGVGGVGGIGGLGALGALGAAAAIAAGANSNAITPAVASPAAP